MEEDNRIINDNYEYLRSYICEDCAKISYCEMNEELTECSFCGSKNIYRNITEDDLNEFGEEIVKDEQEYTCENCYEQFTSIATENIKCPHCGYVHEELTPIDPADREPEWIPSDDEYEDVFNDD